jgi:outer membrane receptor for ferric coprogen and ferric-rhodotorulic acid
MQTLLARGMGSEVKLRAVSDAANELRLAGNVRGRMIVVAGHTASRSSARS